MSPRQFGALCTRPDRARGLRTHSRRQVLLLGATCALAACSSKPVAQRPQAGAALQGSFGRLDGGIVQLQQLRGRVTLLLFFASFDMASQIAAQRLIDFVHSHSPRVNALAIALEIPKNIDLVRSFRDVLSPPFDVVMSNLEAAQGSLGGEPLRSVPTVWVLDRFGVKREEFSGSPTVTQLREVVERVQ